MRVFATITAVNDPSRGWYKARTIFGTNCDGVSLRGVPLTIGQQVAVFEVDGEFGSFDPLGVYKSLLEVPGRYQENFYRQNKAGAALGYIANKVGNVRNDYAVGTITGILSQNLRVTGRRIGQNVVIPVERLLPSSFKVGQTVLVRLNPKPVKVLGWWRTVPTLTTYIRFRYETITGQLIDNRITISGLEQWVGNIPVTTGRIIMSEVSDEFLSLREISGPIFNHDSLIIHRSLGTDDYIYISCSLWWLPGYRWYRFNKTDFSFIFADTSLGDPDPAWWPGFFPNLPQPSTSLTEDGKWFEGQIEGEIRQRNVAVDGQWIGGTFVWNGYPVSKKIPAGMLSVFWFPARNTIYTRVFP